MSIWARDRWADPSVSPFPHIWSGTHFIWLLWWLSDNPLEPLEQFLTYSRCSINVLFSVKMVWRVTGWLDVIISFAILWSVYDMQAYAILVRPVLKGLSVGEWVQAPVGWWTYDFYHFFFIFGGSREPMAFKIEKEFMWINNFINRQVRLYK